jgi:hypothetical protein
MKLFVSLFVLFVYFAVPSFSATSVTQFGITWTFDRNYPAGQFCNGDWWVAGPVNIVTISPASTVQSGGHVINGSMINPETGNVNPNTGSGLHVFQGFDSRLYNYSVSYNPARPGNLDLSPSNPLVVPVGSSLLSAISRQGIPSWATKEMCLLTVAVLTVLDTIPPANSFRPAYCGHNKTVKFNKADLDYTKLGGYPLIGSTGILAKGAGPHGVNDELYQGDTYERMVERPWLDFGYDMMGSYMHPQYNMQPDGAWLAGQVSEIALVLNSGNYTNAQKEKLMIGLVQIGIDNFGVHDGANVQWGTWNNNGQICSGRKFPILFAGMVLNTPAAAGMKNIGQVSIDALSRGATGYVSFAEDEQTFYVTAHPNSQTDAQKRAIWAAQTDQDYDIFVPNPDESNPDGKIEYRVHRHGAGYYGHASPGKGMDFREYLAGPYVAGTEFDTGAGHEGMPEWGISHCGLRDYDGLDWDAPYRKGNGMFWAGFILATHMMGGKELWNHPALFDYMDRYMILQNNSQNPPWTGSMWAAYRDQLSPVKYSSPTDAIALVSGTVAYTNPVKNILTIQDPRMGAIRSLQVMSLAGDIIKSANNTTCLNIGDLKAGVYLVRIKTETGKKIVRVVKCE